MATNEVLSNPAHAAHMADLLFASFVFVADAEDGLSAREVQSLHDSLQDPAWCTQPAVRDGLIALRGSFADLWKDYQKGSRPDPRSIGSRLNQVVATSQGLSRSEIAAGVNLFLDRVLDNASSILQRLGLGSTSAAKQKARQTLSEHLTLGDADSPGDATALRAVGDEARAAWASVATAAPAQDADLSMWPAAQLDFTPEQVWKRGRTPVRCITVIPETHDVRTFVFQAVSPVLFRYKPGQFATLELPIDGKTVRRSYTLSSSPSRPHAISITVKRVPGGLVSNWLHDNMVPGFQFNLSGPNGEFTCFDAPAEKLLFISGGSGITPVMSMTRWLVDTQSPADIVFINNVRTPADVIFDKELHYLATRLGARLRLGIVPGSVQPGQEWNGPVTFFNEGLLRALAPDFAERMVFVCGPPPYMDAVRKLLESLGFPMARYHQESFGGAPAAGAKPAGAAPAAAATAPAPAVRTATPNGSAPAVVPAKPAQPPAGTPAPVVAASGTIEVVFSRSGKTLRASPDDYLLDLAEMNDVRMESSCRAGNCGTCKVRRQEGEVLMDDPRGLSEADLLDGFVLACIGRAGSKRVVLEA